METLTLEIQYEIFSYMNEYEMFEILFSVPHFDSQLNSLGKMIDYYKKDDQDIKVPMMRDIIKIIESSRYELLEFYRNLFDFPKYDEFILSWVILFGEESFVQYYWDQKKGKTHHFFKFYSDSTQLIYGLELISLKMRNRFLIHDFYGVLNVISKYSFQNQDILFIYKNYHRLQRKNPIPLRMLYEMKEIYRSWILLNPSFMFFYIERIECEDEE